MTRTHDDLVEVPCRVTLSRALAHGARYGLCRRVVMKGKGKDRYLYSLTLQLIDPERVLAATRSARYRGPRLVLKDRELETLAVRLRSGRFVSLEEWLQ